MSPASPTVPTACGPLPRTLPRLAVVLFLCFVLLGPGASLAAAAPRAQLPGPGERLSYELVGTRGDQPWEARAGLFENVVDVSVTAEGRAFVLDGASRVHRLEPNGSWSALVSDPVLVRRLGPASAIDLGPDQTPYLLFPAVGAVAALRDDGFEALFETGDSAYRDLALGEGPRFYLGRAAAYRLDDCSELPPGAPREPEYETTGVDVFDAEGRRLQRVGSEHLADTSRVEVDEKGRIFVLSRRVSASSCRGAPSTPRPRPSPTRRPSAGLAPPLGARAGSRPSQAPAERAISGLVAFDRGGVHRFTVPRDNLDDLAVSAAGVVAVDYRASSRDLHGVRTLAPNTVFDLRGAALHERAGPGPSVPRIDRDDAGRLYGTYSHCDHEGLLVWDDEADVLAFGSGDRPRLEGPILPRRVSAGDELAVLEGAYTEQVEQIGGNRRTQLKQDLFTRLAIQRWPLGRGDGQRPIGQLGACTALHGLYTYPVLDVATDGADLFTVLPGRIDLRDGVHLPRLLYPPTEGSPPLALPAFLERAHARDGRLAILDSGRGEALTLRGSSSAFVPWRIAAATNGLPTDIAIGPEDPLFPTRLFLADRGRNRVLWHEPETGRDGAWPTHDGPLSIATGPSGDLFVLGRGGWGLRYAPDGALRAWWRVPDPAVEVQDLSVDDEGLVYVSYARLGEELSARNPSRRILGAGVWVFAPRILPVAPEGEPKLGRCLVDADKRASPSSLELGQEVEIRLNLQGSCPGRTSPAQVAIVFDTSWSMSPTFADSIGRGVAAVREVLRALDAEHVEIALVSFGDGAALELPLGASFQDVEAALRRLRADGDTRMAAGLDIARTELTGPRAREGYRKVLLLVSDGVPKDAPMEVADEVRAAGIDTYGLILPFEDFTADHESYLQRLVGGPERYLLNPRPAELDAFAKSLTSYEPNPGLLERATVRDVLPANMDYIEGSSEPPAVWDPADRSLTWEVPETEAAKGVELRFRVRPRELGRWPTNEEAAAEILDATGAEGRLYFPVPEVEALAPPTPVPTPTRDLRIAYLPIAVSESCLAARRPIDLVLVMDVSGSMRGPTRDGRSRLAAAVEAAGLLVDGLDGFDRAGLVTFDARAHMLAPLNFDLRGVRAGLAAAEAGTGTRIDLGIDLARRLMTMAQPRQGARRAILLLTDGLSTSVPHDVAVREAERARAEGITLHAVSLGDEVDRAALRRMVGPEGIHRHAPDGEDLAGIFGALAETLPCDPRGFWGGRP